MLKHLFLLLLIIILSVAFGVWFKTDPGYVLIIFHHWQVETSIVVLLLLLAFSLILFKFGAQLIKSMLCLPKRLKHLLNNWKSHRQEKHVNQGLEAFFQDKWQDTIKKIQPLQNKSSWNVDLLAAEAAQHQGAIALRDQFIHSALQQSPQAKESILLYQAKLQIALHQYEQAQATLNSLPKEFQNHSAQWLNLQLQLDYQFQNFETGLKRLQRYQVLFSSPDNHQQQYKMFLKAILLEKFQQQDTELALRLFEKSPKTIQQNDELLAVVAPHCQAFPKIQKKVFKLIKKKLQEKPTPELLQVLPQLPYQNHWIDLLNKLSQNLTHDHLLLCIMGILKAKQKLWGSAMIDLQQSIEIKPTHQAYSALAQVYLDLDQSTNALQVMQKALELND